MRVSVASTAARRALRRQETLRVAGRCIQFTGSTTQPLAVGLRSAPSRLVAAKVRASIRPSALIVIAGNFGFQEPVVVDGVDKFRAGAIAARGRQVCRFGSFVFLLWKMRMRNRQDRLWRQRTAKHTSRHNGAARELPCAANAHCWFGSRPTAGLKLINLL